MQALQKFVASSVSWLDLKTAQSVSSALSFNPLVKRIIMKLLLIIAGIFLLAFHPILGVICIVVGLVA